MLLPKPLLAGVAMALCLAALCFAILGCGPPAAPPPGAPRLVLLVVVDQFRGDYLDRFAPLWTGGVRRLLDDGLVFEDAHHRHAVTHTASGHATLATGRHPRRHGIISNYWFDPLSHDRVYSVEDPRHGVSPANLLAPTLGDWLKQRSPRSRVFAASGKDRAAVTLAGRLADAAFWFKEGDWVSSGYYSGAQAAWVDDFNGQALADGQFGAAWEPLPVAPGQLAAAGVEALDLEPLRSGFPHSSGGLSVAPEETFRRQLAGMPWVDESLTRFAERLLAEEDLGADGWTDLLALGYSALDSAGHGYGPDSPEVLDVLLRFDLLLGELLELVDRRIGLDNVVVALSSDHGVAPVPELGRSGGRRLTAAGVLCFQQVNNRLAERFGEARWLLNGPFVNPEAVAEHGIERSGSKRRRPVCSRPAPGSPESGGVASWARTRQPDARAFANSFHAGRSPDLMIQFEPFFQPTRSLATHGSAYDYDTHVPLVLLAPGIRPGRDEAPAATVDLAPTLAALAGLPAPDVDGVDLGAAARGSRPTGRATDASRQRRSRIRTAMPSCDSALLGRCASARRRGGFDDCGTWR